ncbi:MAG TPA: aldo/keto reductase [Balneolaceae bacterium]|nr:aldo/keto reductase [Balneolaceae bacterium]
MMKSFKFRNGDTVEAIGLGTWKSDPGKVGAAVESALKTGYRHIDCAAVYGNEAEVGNALAETFSTTDINRENVHITSKLWNTAHRKQDVIPALKKSLNDLKLDYLDLYLMHWPVAFKPGLEGFPQGEEDYLSLDEVPIIETWEAMLEAKQQGLIRHAGVSNFSIEKLEDLKSKTDDFPEMNQVELHPYLQQQELVDYGKANDMLITAYSPLGSSDRPEMMKSDDEPALLDNDVIGSIAEKHDATPAQVLIKWAVGRDTIVIPKSTNEGRIAENLKSAEIDLDSEDHEKIKELNIPYRYLDGEMFETENGMYSNVFDD